MYLQHHYCKYKTDFQSARALKTYVKIKEIMIGSMLFFLCN